MQPTLVDQLARRLGQLQRSKPRRVVTISGYRVRGIVPSLRFRGRMTWESEIEHKLIYRLVTSWKTVDACTQAIRLSIPSTFLGDAAFDYTPDALAQSVDGGLFCIECKPAALLADAELRIRHRDIRLYLEHHGVRFVEVTDAMLSAPAPNENAKALMRGIQATAQVRKTELREIASTALPCSFGALVDHMGSAPARAALFHGHGYFDMHRPLGETTHISTELEDHFDAANFLYA